jgi:hypothetical protein
MTAAPGAVLVLWWITLILTVVLIVPLTVRFLHRTLAAARAIQRYAVDTRAAAEGIVANLGGAAALDEALATAGALLQRAGSPPGAGATEPGPGAAGP